LSIASIVGADIRIAFHDSAARDRCINKISLVAAAKGKFLVPVFTYLLIN